MIGFDVCQESLAIEFGRLGIPELIRDFGFIGYDQRNWQCPERCRKIRLVELNDVGALHHIGNEFALFFYSLLESFLSFPHFTDAFFESFRHVAILLLGSDHGREFFMQTRQTFEGSPGLKPFSPFFTAEEFEGFLTASFDFVFMSRHPATRFFARPNCRNSPCGFLVFSWKGATRGGPNRGSRSRTNGAAKLLNLVLTTNTPFEIKCAMIKN